MNNEYKYARNAKIETFEEQNRLELSLNLSDVYFDKVFSLSAAVLGGFVNAQSEIAYGGRIIVNAVYKSEEMERIEAGAEFTFKRGGIKNAENADVSYEVVSTALTKNGGMLYAEVVVNAKITVFLGEEIQYLANVDSFKRVDMLTAYTNVFAVGELELEDEYTSEKLKRVLFSEARALVKKTECADGVLILDGEVILTLVMLPFSSNSDILKETRIIPFRYELDSPKTIVGDTCYSSVSVSKVAVTVYVDEEQSTQRLETIVKLSVFGVTCHEYELEAVVDAFSRENELILTDNELNCELVSDCVCSTERVSGKAECEVPENSRFITAIGERVELSAVQYENGILNVSALISGDALFVSDDIELCSKFELPFAFEMKANQPKSVRLTLKSFSIKLRSGKLEVDAEVAVCYFETRKACSKIVANLEVGGEKTKNDAAFSVYLACRGDTEWDVVKTLGEDIDKIYEFNPNLEFPLKGDEKIILFRQG